MPGALEFIDVDPVLDTANPPPTADSNHERDLPQRPWRRSTEHGAWSTPLPRPARAAGSPSERVRATCILLAGEDPEELEAAGSSALEQATPFDEVLVAELDPEGRAGELERLHHTLRVARGEVLCFLRAEDRFEPGHLERCLAVFDARPACGVVDVAYRRFGRREEVVRRPGAEERTVVQAALARTHIAADLRPPALSALALRRTVLEPLLPLPTEVLRDWPRDPCEPLLRAALGTGATRGFVAELGVRVRVDDAAFDTRRDEDVGREYRNRLALERLFRHLDARTGHGPALAGLAPLEFRALGRTTRAELGAYLDLVLRSELALGRRLAMASAILARHLRWRAR